MDADEREIYYYLKPRKGSFETFRDICRYAGNKKRVRYNPEWALPAIARMIERGILENDGKDGYRIKPKPDDGGSVKLWASPAMTKILKDSGKEFDTKFLVNVDEDAYYDKL